jgi:ParB family chromosome partitioning protein
VTTKKELGSKASPRGLGRGLASLIPSTPAPVEQPLGNETKAEDSGERVHYIPIQNIIPNRYQPRTKWDQEKLRELASSIQASGLLQPLLVRPMENKAGSYELIAGERRWRALQLAGLKTAPVIIRKVNSKTSLEIAIIENIQREDLNSIEEALAYKRLIHEFNYSQEELSQKVGKDRSTVTNALRLLNLPEEIRKDVMDGQISAGHARALLSLERDRDRLSLNKLIKSKGMSVRETERLVKEARQRSQTLKPAAEVNPQIRFLEESLMAILGTKTMIKHRGRRGKIEIEYYSLEDLDRLVDLIRKTNA